MHKKALKALPWDNIWVNLRVTSREHRDTAAAYVIIHEATGRYYFGATSGLYMHFQVTSSVLKSQKHGNRGLQKAFNRDQRLRVVGVITSAEGRDPGEARLAAEEIKQLWIAAHKGDPLMFNEIQARDANPRTRPWRQRQVCVQGHVFTNPREAASVLGLTERWVRKHCEDAELVNWQWV